MTYVGAVPTTGDFKVLDSITTSSATTFNLRQGGVAVYPQSSSHCLVVLNGILQTGGSSFNIVNDTIVFASSLSSDDVINQILVLGNVNDIGVPSDDTVSTAKIQANAVTAAKFNADVISGQTELAAEPADTDEFLVSDAGVIKRIDYSHIKGGGGLVYTGGSSSTSEVGDLTADNVFNSTYQNYLIVYGATVISGSNNTKLQAQVRHGGTTVTGSEYHSVHGFIDSTTSAGGHNMSSTNSNNADRITLGADAMSNSANLKTCVGTLYCFDMNASDEFKVFVNDTTNLSWGGYYQRGTSGHAYVADQAIDGFKFFANSGNLRCGYFRVYGIVNS